MFPLSGGVVRFPHMAFGSFASYTIGLDHLGRRRRRPRRSRSRARCSTRTKYAPFTDEHTVAGETVHTLTALGYVVAVLLMAVFVVVNYFGVRWFARINNVAGVVEARHHPAGDRRVLRHRRSTARTSPTTASRPTGWHGVFTAIATGGIVFSYLGFRQGIELAGETDNPRRNVPIAVIGSVLLTGVIYVAAAGRLHRRARARRTWLSRRLGATSASPTTSARSPRWPRSSGWAGWPALLYVDAIVSPADTGLIYTTVTVADLLRDGAATATRPTALASTTDRGVPLVSLLVAFVVGLIVFLPFPSWQQLVGFITSATVLSFGSGPARAGRAAQADPRAGAAVPAAGRARHPAAGVLGLQPDRLLVRLDDRTGSCSSRCSSGSCCSAIFEMTGSTQPRPRMARRPDVGAAMVRWTRPAVVPR